MAEWRALPEIFFIRGQGSFMSNMVGTLWILSERHVASTWSPPAY